MTNTISQSAGDHAIIFGSIGQVGTINILKLDPTVGGKVSIAPFENQLPPKLRPLPIVLPPRSFPLLLGRREEVKVALDALPYDQPVEFYGLAGIGKTVIVRYLAHHPSITPAFPDGIIYHQCTRHEPISDLLQILFHAFYESSITFKPSDIEIREALKDKKALILLDGARLTREEVQGIINSLRSFTFLFTSLERQLWGEGHAVGLSGLALNDAVSLVARELGHTLSAEERQSAETLCTALEGDPLRIIQSVALVREENLSLSAIAQRFTTTTKNAWTEQLLSSLKKPQRIILVLLAALGANIALGAERIADLTEVAEVKPLLETLLRRNLIQVDGERYSLASSLVEDLRQNSDITAWMERAITYFTNLIPQHQGISGSLVEESDAILQVVEWAVGVGRWSDVLTLGKAIEGGLALSGKWGTWENLLKCILEAARITGNQAVEAFALHQLGTRALCLNQITEAQTYLTQALRIRESLNDQAGIEVTNHNLQFLSNPPLPPPPEPHRELVDNSNPEDVSPLIRLGSVFTIFLLGALGIWLILPLFNNIKQDVPLSVIPSNTSPPTSGSTDTNPSNTNSSTSGSTDTNPSNTNSSTSGSTDTNPSNTNSSTSGSTDTNPSNTNSSSSGSTDTNPSNTNSSSSGSTDTNPSNTNSSTSSSTDTNPSNTNSSTSSSTDTNPSNTNSSSSGSTDTNPSNTNSSTSSSTDTNPSNTNSSTSSSTDTNPSNTNSSTSSSTDTNPSSDRTDILIREGALPAKSTNSAGASVSPTLKSLSLFTTKAYRGDIVRGTVTLNNPAPPGGIKVNLEGSDSFLVRRQTIPFSEGEVTKEFKFTVNKALRDGETSNTVIVVDIIASYGAKKLPPQKLTVEIFG
ncbi:hypothetical protein JYQ62_24760 [Nostoc sp. UHCC 0702]|nr:hypothetical protein JYQ62_24760 [Nostoc sp. UHCC 0702]